MRYSANNVFPPPSHGRTIQETRNIPDSYEGICTEGRYTPSCIAFGVPKQSARGDREAEAEGEDQKVFSVSRLRGGL